MQLSSGELFRAAAGAIYRERASERSHAADCIIAPDYNGPFFPPLICSHLVVFFLCRGRRGELNLDLQGCDTYVVI